MSKQSISKQKFRYPIMQETSHFKIAQISFPLRSFQSYFEFFPCSKYSRPCSKNYKFTSLKNIPRFNRRHITSRATIFCTGVEQNKRCYILQINIQSMKMKIRTLQKQTINQMIRKFSNQYETGVKMVQFATIMFLV